MSWWAAAATFASVATVGFIVEYTVNKRYAVGIYFCATVFISNKTYMGMVLRVQYFSPVTYTL